MAETEPIKVQIEGLEGLQEVVREFHEAAREMRRAALIAEHAGRALNAASKKGSK